MDDPRPPDPHQPRRRAHPHQPTTTPGWRTRPRNEGTGWVSDIQQAKPNDNDEHKQGAHNREHGKTNGQRLPVGDYPGDAHTPGTYPLQVHTLLRTQFVPHIRVFIRDGSYPVKPMNPLYSTGTHSPPQEAPMGDPSIPPWSGFCAERTTGGDPTSPTPRTVQSSTPPPPQIMPC